MTKPAKKPVRVPNKASGRQRPVPFKDVVQKLLETPPEPRMSQRAKRK